MHEVRSTQFQHAAQPFRPNAHAATFFRLRMRSIPQISGRCISDRSSRKHTFNSTSKSERRSRYAERARPDVSGTAALAGGFPAA
ncbi:hypothetical protein ACNJUL_21395, partial [Mycobacterium tuberculosis]